MDEWGRLRDRPARSRKWWNRRPSTTRGILLDAVLVGAALALVLPLLVDDDYYAYSYAVSFATLRGAFNTYLTRRSRR